MRIEDININNTSGENINPVTDETVILLRRIVKMLESNTVVDSSMRQKITVESQSAQSSYYHYGSNWLQAGSTNTAPYSVGSSSVGYFQPTWAGPIDPRYTNIEMARIAYNGLRSNLIWTP